MTNPERSDALSDPENISYVAHELRAPLAIVGGYASLLLDGGAGDLDDDQREIVDRMRRSVVRLERMISEFADFLRTRVDSDPAVLVEEFDVRTRLEECADVARAFASGKEVEITCESEGAPVLARGDSITIRRTLLAVAAYLARGTRNGKIHVGLEELPGNGVRVSFTSSGMTLPEQFLDDPFASVEGLDDRAAWRLGVTAARSSVERAGGRFVVAGTGDGVSIQIDLPKG